MVVHYTIEAKVSKKSIPSVCSLSFATTHAFSFSTNLLDLVFDLKIHIALMEVFPSKYYLQVPMHGFLL